MKNTFKKIAGLVLSLVLCLSLAISVFAISADTYRGYVRLSANEKSVTSKQFGGVVGRGEVSNHSGSAGAVNIELQSSSGSSWKSLTTITAEPGQIKSSNSWGNGEDQLFRIIVSAKDAPWFGNPGCIAYGYIYTGN